ncbi:hypothetical protein BCR35DRAFT_314802 [Leucosporidium creatinivorum]|uniref:SHSP domain-containing protein n=1 Tax=Leucosporidium creatinivorum TaxID=106004 RepID=A0A1Y2ESY0_9BASI|nr:hypothetical protein BCR35DRAFT_314802 [Leucosporidium creatinivorum]
MGRLSPPRGGETSARTSASDSLPSTSTLVLLSTLSAQLLVGTMSAYQSLPLVYPSFDPYGDFLGFQWTGDTFHGRPMTFVEPKMDCVLLGNDMLCSLELPGVKKEDLTLTLRESAVLRSLYFAERHR